MTYYVRYHKEDWRTGKPYAGGGEGPIEEPFDSDEDALRRAAEINEATPGAVLKILKDGREWLSLHGVAQATRAYRQGNDWRRFAKF